MRCAASVPKLTAEIGLMAAAADDVPVLGNDRVVTSGAIASAASVLRRYQVAEYASLRSLFDPTVLDGLDRCHARRSQVHLIDARCPAGGVPIQ
jgi:hypothetical protein